MSSRFKASFTLAVSATLAACSGTELVDSPQQIEGPLAAAKGPKGPSASAFATMISLPTLSGRTGEALAVNNDGSVIAGHAWERNGTMRALRWDRQQDGSWSLTVLPEAATATGAIARAVNRAGDIAGNFWPGNAPEVVLWPAAGSFADLGCNDHGRGNAISADGQVVAGSVDPSQPGIAAVWRPGSCREELPPLAAPAYANAQAINGNGTIVGGFGGLDETGPAYPTRWKFLSGQWQAEQLDTRQGSVYGANVAGDLAGQVRVACQDPDGCPRPAIWYAAGGSLQLGTLNGTSAWARGINASGDVVGISVNAKGNSTAFYYFAATQQMVALPGAGAGAFAVSDIRPDGTRIVVGINSRAAPVAWTVRTP